MATTRPYMQMGIGDLEDIFEKQGKNFATLGRLKHELSHRQVPRAVALLERIQKAETRLNELEGQRPDPESPRTALQLNPKSQATGPISSSHDAPEEAQPSLPGLMTYPKQPDLWSNSQPPTVASMTNTKATVAPAPEITIAKKSVPPELPIPLPQLAHEDACRILKVASGDAWEKIEAARRKLVTKSSPLATAGLTVDQAQKLLAEARLANGAAIVIAARRSGRH